MDLDVVKMRNSRASSVLTGDEFMAWIMLICASWHQEPAASLPDDDVELAKLAGFGRMVSAWLAVKEGALYGWVKCSDGRLYHPVVAEKAAAAWTNKLKARHRRTGGRRTHSTLGVCRMRTRCIPT